MKTETLSLVGTKETSRKVVSQKKTQKRKGMSAAKLFRVGMTVGLGCGVPLLSLALSKTAGTLTAHCWPLALFAFLLMLAVLAVSLPHLAWSIADITRSGFRASWSLAVALDMSLVLCEFVQTFAQDAGLSWVIYAVMASVCVASMLLNCHAFFMAPNGH